MPDSGLFEGRSWNKNNTQSGDMKFDMNSKYTITSLEDDLAEISVRGKINNSKNTTTKFMGYDVTSDLNGDQEGEFKVSMIYGLLLYSKTTTSVKGDIQVMGKNVPIKFKVKKEITSKKM